MFGGFDGSFFNDLNIIDINSSNKTQVMVSSSTILKDYKKMINCHDSSDIIFVLDNAHKQKIYANKGLTLFRLMFHESPQDLTD
jgi:hypothetical protein